MTTWNANLDVSLIVHKAGVDHPVADWAVKPVVNKLSYWGTAKADSTTYRSIGCGDRGQSPITNALTLRDFGDRAMLFHSNSTSITTIQTCVTIMALSYWLSEGSYWLFAGAGQDLLLIPRGTVCFVWLRTLVHQENNQDVSPVVTMSSCITD